jgi:hypothetical protein
MKKWFKNLKVSQKLIHRSLAQLVQEADLDRISASLQTALNEDANFHGSSATLQATVPLALQEYRDATEVFINLTKHLVDVEKMDVTAKAYLEAGTRARQTSFKLWRIADAELDLLLEKRIEAYERSRGRSLTVRVAKGDGHINISVLDIGIGIPSGEPDSHFQPWLHDPEGRTWLRPAQRCAGRPGNGRPTLRAERRPGPRRHLHLGIASPSGRTSPHSHHRTASTCRLI